MFSCFFAFSMEIFSLGGGEENFSTKNKGGWRTSSHTYEHGMERISLHPSIYFPTSHTKSIGFAIIFHLVIKRTLRVRSISWILFRNLRYMETDEALDLFTLISSCHNFACFSCGPSTCLFFTTLLIVFFQTMGFVRVPSASEISSTWMILLDMVVMGSFSSLGSIFKFQVLGYYEAQSLVMV